MALQYQTISERDLGAGIDARSSENSLAPGFSQDILNGDCVERRVRKRNGYQGYAGSLPIRVSEIKYTDDVSSNIKFTLDSSIDLANIPTTPIILYGRTSSQNTGNVGRFANDADTAKYYPSFTANPRITFQAGSHTLSLSQQEHGFFSANLFVGVTESTSPTDFSNELFAVTEVRVDQSSYEVEIDYVNSGSEFEGFVYFADKQAVSGETYVSGNTTIGMGATSVITINAGTHGLDSFNIQVRVFQDDTTENVSIVPDSVTVNPSSGQVVVTVTNPSGGSIDVFSVLTISPIANVVTGSVAPMSSAILTISDFSGVWPFLGVYKELTLGGVLQEVTPDAVIYNAVTGNLSLEFTNGTASSINYKIFWDSGRIITNQLYVTDSETIVSGFEDSSPQLTIWGIGHENIYSTSGNREGWINHIDTYRRPLEERLITGLGGNLFAARTITEIGDQYLLPSLYPNLSNRVDDETVIGPLFYSAGSPPARSRGCIAGTNIGANWARVKSVTWNSAEERADYVLEIEDLEILDSTGTPTSLASVISVAANEEDYLTIRGCGFSVHDGTFRIVAVDTLSATEIEISVDNPDLFLSDYNETDSGALAGVFTDQLVLLSDSIFFPGDIVVSQLFAAESFMSVLTSSVDTIVLSGVVDVITVPLGLRLQGSRVSNIVPMRDSSGTASVENLVAGDSLGYSAIERLLQINSICTAAARSITIEGDASTETATVTFLSGDTSDLSVGDSIPLLYAGSYTGVQVITEILSSTELTFTSDLDDNETATIPTNFIEVDEQLPWQDLSDNSNYFSVNSRWIPIEAPDDAFELTPSTHVKYFEGEYTDQAFLRSVMVNDNMYFVNGQDEVMKFDGTNMYRAGLPRWQLGTFLTLDDSGAVIVTNTPTSAVSAVANNQFTIPTGESTLFLVGQRIRYDDGSETEDYVITGLVDSLVTVDRNITLGSTGDITKISTYRYYYRLNAVDANDNIVASAVVGSENFRVDVAADTAIHHQLTGFPAWDNYDFVRIEAEIYRTVIDTPAPFYKITNIPLSFNQNDGYLHFVDTVQDAELQDQTQLDITSGVVSGEVNLQATWSEPIRAKYLSSVGNRLILANLKDYPELDIQLNDQGNIADNDDLHGFIWSFRRDNSTAGAVASTDMLNTARYEWVDGDASTPATAVLNLTADITLTNAVVSSLRTTNTFTLQVLAAAANPTDTVLVTFSGTAAAIVCTVTPNNGANNGAVPVAMTTAQLREAITTGAVAAYTGAGAGTLTLTDASSLRALQTATGGGATPLADGGEGDAVLGTFSGGAIGAIDINSVTPAGGNEVTFDIGLHTLVEGNWIYVYHSEKGPTHSSMYCGWHQIHEVTATTVTVNYKNSAQAGTVDSLVIATDPYDIPVLLGLDGNRDTRSDRNSSILRAISDAVYRLSQAINASMRVTDITLSGYEDFTPWLIASAGDEFQPGQILVRQPRVDSVIPEVVLPASIPADFDIFVGNLRRVASAQVSATEALYPSRVIQSYPNFPEIFENPLAVSEQESDQIRDINSSDGQEVTGVIPFFSDSIASASSKEAVVLAFKSNSVYLYSTAISNEAQKLETQGLGCTAPFSIAPSKNSIVFANDSGIYRINRDLQMEYVGERMERNWLSQVNRNQLDLVQATNFALGRQYKLSVPIGADATANSEVYTYDHSREGQTWGAWTRYDNHPATGWTNTKLDSYFGSTSGRVFERRRTGLVQDFRDDSSPVNFIHTHRAMDFDDPGARKSIAAVISHFRQIADSVSSTLAVSTELSSTFQSTDAFVLSVEEGVTNLSDIADRSVVAIRASVSSRNFNYIQLQYANAAIDEPMEIAGFSFRVALLSERGTQEARDTANPRGR